MAKTKPATKARFNQKPEPKKANGKELRNRPYGNDVARDLIEGLTEFVGDLRSGRPLAKKYGQHAIAITPPEEMKPQFVVKVRTNLNLSQALFADFLGVTKKAVASWEQGQQPMPMVCRIITLINRDPDYFRSRLAELMNVMDRKPRAGTKGRPRMAAG